MNNYHYRTLIYKNICIYKSFNNGFNINECRCSKNEQSVLNNHIFLILPPKCLKPYMVTWYIHTYILCIYNALISNIVYFGYKILFTTLVLNLFSFFGFFVFCFK